VQQWIYWSSTLYLFAFTFCGIKLVILDLFGTVFVDLAFENVLWREAIITLLWDIVFVPVFFVLLLLLPKTWSMKYAQGMRVFLAITLLTLLTFVRVVKRFDFFSTQQVIPENHHTDSKVNYWLPRFIIFGKTFFEIICKCFIIVPLLPSSFVPYLLVLIHYSLCFCVTSSWFLVDILEMYQFALGVLSTNIEVYTRAGKIRATRTTRND
jgi:hypothetical protein